MKVLDGDRMLTDTDNLPETLSVMVVERVYTGVPCPKCVSRNTSCSKIKVVNGYFESYICRECGNDWLDSGNLPSAVRK